MRSINKSVGNECAGCFACYNACPYNAIKMQLSEKGFYHPIINNKKCKKCDICTRVCPIISPPTLERFFKPVTYIGWSKEEETRVTSSSGGIFSELARVVLEMDGVVYGAVWDPDELKPIHVGTSNIDVVKEMRGSKYVQSYIGKAYRQVVNELEQERYVLFSGTPCQIAALYNIVPLELRFRLYTINVVCWGVASLKFFKNYLAYIAQNRKIISLNMRDKSYGWSKFGMKIKFDDGTTYISPHYKDPFFIGYLNKLVLNDICYKCSFCRIPAIGDITLGDFWGAPKELHNKKGVSVILINSDKGQKLIELVKDRVTLIPVPFEIVIKANRRIVSGFLKKPRERKRIMKLIIQNRSEDMIKLLKWLKLRNDISYIIIGYPSLVFRKLEKFLKSFIVTK